MHQPVPIPTDRVEKLCLMGQGAKCCSFLGMSGSGPLCLKGSMYAPQIQERRRQQTMGAMGDNCTGHPDFKLIVDVSATVTGREPGKG
jgi:hypothetical protein